ncbi:MAG: GTPase Era [Myxococcota bacterium]
MSAYRAGVVAILGRPNAGKSTLLNAILGEKLAIVTAKPQTTRSRILGIHTRPDAQLLFVDTPGLHESERVLNGALIGQALEAGDDCDVALLLVDLTGRWGADHTALLADLESKGKPVLVVGTKDDLAKEDVEWPPPGVERAFRVAARRREGVDALVDAAAALLPESPPLYPEDDLSDRPLRFLVAELVREAAFDSLEQELPYVLAVEIEQFDESRPELVKIRANLIVERKSQKPIVIGREGRRIKRIGTRARHEIEKLLDTRVHLELWVKIEPNWTKKPARIESLGYV